MSGVNENPVMEPVRNLCTGPNPMHAKTTFSFALPGENKVDFKIYNVDGRVLRTLVNRRLSEGVHNIIWDGCDDAGRRVAGGVYLAQLKSDEMTQTGKVLLIR